MVTAFAAAGRASHDREQSLATVAHTAWPFLAGMALGWLGVWLWRRRTPLTLTDGVPVWLSTVVLGMALRAATGGGTALSFVGVALVVLGALILGWRLIAGTLLRYRAA